MATWIKAGFWEKLCKPCQGYKGWLNLDELIQSLIPPVPPAPGSTYRSYVALLSAINPGNAPIVTSLLQDDFGDVTFGYSYPNGFTITSADFSNPSKIIGFCYSGWDDDSNYRGFVVKDAGTPNTLIMIGDTSGGDPIHVQIRLEIRVYN